MLKSGASQPVAPSFPREMLKMGRSGRLIPNSCRCPPMKRTRWLAGSSMTFAAVIAQLGRFGQPVDVVTGQGE